MFPIALTMIMSVNQYPSTINGYSGDWDKIIDNYKNHSNIGNDILYHWIAEVGDICHAEYGSQTPVSNAEALSFLKSFPRYHNVAMTSSLSESQILAKLAFGYPIYYSGFTRDTGVGHAFVIDGVCKQKYYKQDLFNIGSSEKEYTHEVSLVHCNLGWYGNCNGYYKIGMFDTSKIVVIDDKNNYTYDFTDRTTFITYTL